jgi:16S rRNA (cytosine967-C5)-methyltransferase
LKRENPREIAADVLSRRDPGEYIEDVLERALEKNPLRTDDRGLCQELVYGVLRNQSALDWLIARKTGGKDQKPALRTLLRLGLYQIFWTSRIPGHAAVNETVESAKRRGFGPQAGFVNAVLRGYLRETLQTREVLDALKESEPWIAYSHPDWLTKRWMERWGKEAARRLLEWNNTPPDTFARVNLLKVEPGKLLEQWREEAVDYDFVRGDWLEENSIFKLKQHPPLKRLGSFNLGYFYIQDPSTLLAVRQLAPRSGSAVLDMCAAPGGKLTVAAQMMQNQGRLTAVDVSAERLALVRENCRRLGAANVEFRLADDMPREKEAYDAVLIDAPCSNTGVMRRRLDLRWRIQPAEIERLRSTQLQLLAQGAAALKPGGTLVYSTCSMEPEENRKVIEEFLSNLPRLQLQSERSLLPFVDAVDGAYVATLR